MIRISINFFYYLFIFTISGVKTEYKDCFEQCIPFSNCYTAQTFFKENGTYPNVCYFINHEPYVCCNQEIPLVKSYYETLRISEKVCQKLSPPTIRPVVVGGYETKSGEFPFMTAIGYGNINDHIYNCGGFLIDRNYVITAAHCATYNDEIASAVRIGGNPLSDKATKPIPVVKVIIHPDYNGRTNHNDIAILVLSHPVHEKPACLWTFGKLDLQLQSDVISAGYGSTSFGGPFSRRLLKVFMTVLDNSKCIEYYKNQEIIDSQLCVIGKERYLNGTDYVIQDTCQGDSGGPLILGERVVGIVSYGQSCGSTIPGIYTNISSYLGWIESVVWPKNSTEEMLILS